MRLFEVFRPKGLTPFEPGRTLRFVRWLSNTRIQLGRKDGIRTMMMPHSSFQRDLSLARRQRFERTPRRERIGIAAATGHRARPFGSLRVQVGRALIGVGTRLSGERVEAVRPSAHRPA
jgi:hypothetical protein